VTTLEDYAINARGFGAWITRSNGREKLSAHAHIGTRVIAHGTKLTGVRFRGDVLSWRAGGSLRSVRLR
jgi:hypothetical protein